MDRYSIVAESGWDDYEDDSGEWVRYEDVKGLELQVMTLTEQLSKMERKSTENEIIDKIQVLNLKPNDILVLKAKCLYPPRIQKNTIDFFKKLLQENRFSNEVIYIEDIDLQIIRKDD